MEGQGGSFPLSRAMGEFSPFRTRRVDGMTQKGQQQDDVSGTEESTEGSKGRRRGSSENRKWVGGLEQRSFSK